MFLNFLIFFIFSFFRKFEFFFFIFDVFFCFLFLKNWFCGDSRTCCGYYLVTTGKVLSSAPATSDSFPAKSTSVLFLVDTV